MRRSFQRALAMAGAVCALAGSLVASATTTAHAEAPGCPGGSEVTEFDSVVGGKYRVAGMPVSPAEFHLCIQVATWERFVVVVRTGVPTTPPKVTTASGTGSCDTQIINMTAPVPLQLSVGTSGGPGFTVCAGKDFQTQQVSVEFGPLSTPQVEVWLLADSTLNAYGYCAWDLAAYLVNPTDTTYAAWTDCVGRDNRVL